MQRTAADPLEETPDRKSMGLDIGNLMEGPAKEIPKKTPKSQW